MKSISATEFRKDIAGMINQAQSGPIIITKHKKAKWILVSMEMWNSLNKIERNAGTPP